MGGFMLAITEIKTNIMDTMDIDYNEIVVVGEVWVTAISSWLMA